MSAQPLAPPVVDLEIIEALDFEPEYPCEWVKLGKTCGAPGDFLVDSRKTCACPAPPIAMCTECWVRLGRVDAIVTCWHCGQCGIHIGRTRDETFVILCTLKGGKS